MTLIGAANIRFVHGLRVGEMASIRVQDLQEQGFYFCEITRPPCQGVEDLVRVDGPLGGMVARMGGDKWSQSGFLSPLPIWGPRLTRGDATVVVRLGVGGTLVALAASWSLAFARSARPVAPVVGALEVQGDCPKLCVSR